MIGIFGVSAVCPRCPENGGHEKDNDINMLSGCVRVSAIFRSKSLSRKQDTNVSRRKHNREKWRTQRTRTHAAEINTLITQPFSCPKLSAADTVRIADTSMDRLMGVAP